MYLLTEKAGIRHAIPMVNIKDMSVSSEVKEEKFLTVITTCGEKKEYPLKRCFIANEEKYLSLWFCNVEGLEGNVFHLFKEKQNEK